jgi:hypothetical protein
MSTETEAAGHASTIDANTFRVRSLPDGGQVGLSGVQLWPGPQVWSDELCAKLSANISERQWREWISPDIDYRGDLCRNLPTAG